MHGRARGRARDLDVALAAYLRRLVQKDLGTQQMKSDVSCKFDLGRSAAVSNIAEHKARMIGEAIEADFRKKQATLNSPMRLFVDSSVWPAGVDSSDVDKAPAIAWQIGPAFADRDFSLVAGTSFAVRRRLGIEGVASFDNDFAVFRYGPKQRYVFEVVR